MIHELEIFYVFKTRGTSHLRKTPPKKAAAAAGVSQRRRMDLLVLAPGGVVVMAKGADGWHADPAGSQLLRE